MTIDVIQKDMIAAMKSGDKLRKDTLSAMIGNIKKAAIDKMCKDNISEALVDEVLLKEKKTMQEMIDTCPASRVETMEVYKNKMAIINEYTPSIMADADEIRAFVAAAGLEFTKANRPAIMKMLKGKADMKVANSLF